VTGPHRTEQAADAEDRTSSGPDGVESTTAANGTPTTGAAGAESADEGAATTTGVTSTDATEDATSTGTSSEDAKPADATSENATSADVTTPATTATGTGAPTASTADDEDELADAEDQAYRGELRKGLLIGLGSGLLVGLVVALLLGAFVWPGYLTGPGDPQETADRATTALGAKDSAGLEAVSCKAPDGRATAALPPQALQLIGRAAPAGPVQLTLDTEARVPVDLTLNAQGQTQTLPSDLVLGVDDGSWCLNGLAERTQ
jgi:hypothetical protein